MPNLHFAKLGRENCSNPAEYFLPFQKLGHFVTLGVENQATGGQGVPPPRAEDHSWVTPCFRQKLPVTQSQDCPIKAQRHRQKKSRKGRERRGVSAVQ